MLWQENQGVTDLPPYKNLVPEIPRLGAEGNTRLKSGVVLMSSYCFVLPCGASLVLEIIDDMASCTTSCLIQVANGLSDRSGRAGGRWLGDR